jgi:hypothetical protein
MALAEVTRGKSLQQQVLTGHQCDEDNGMILRLKNPNRFLQTYVGIFQPQTPVEDSSATPCYARRW